MKVRLPLMLLGLVLGLVLLLTALKKLSAIVWLSRYLTHSHFIQHKLRPGLKVRAGGQQLLNSREAGFRQALFAALRFWLGQVEDMDDAEMDLAHRRAV